MAVTAETGGIGDDRGMKDFSLTDEVLPMSFPDRGIAYERIAHSLPTTVTHEIGQYRGVAVGSLIVTDTASTQRILALTYGGVH